MVHEDPHHSGDKKQEHSHQGKNTVPNAKNHNHLREKTLHLRSANFLYLQRTDISKAILTQGRFFFFRPLSSFSDFFPNRTNLYYRPPLALHGPFRI